MSCGQHRGENKLAQHTTGPETIQKMRDRKISTTAENFLQLKEEGQKSQTGKIKLNPHLETEWTHIKWKTRKRS